MTTEDASERFPEHQSAAAAAKNKTDYSRSSSIPRLQAEQPDSNLDSAPSTPTKGSSAVFRPVSAGGKRRSKRFNTNGTLELSMAFMAPMTPTGGGAGGGGSSGGSSGLPTTPATTSGTRRKQLSSKLLSKLSVFEGGGGSSSEHTRLVEMPSPGSNSNPNLETTATTPTSSKKSPRRDSRASLLIQQFNEKAKSPLPFAVGQQSPGMSNNINDDANNIITGQPKLSAKLLSPQQVRELVKMNMGGEGAKNNPYLKAYEQVSSQQQQQQQQSSPLRRSESKKNKKKKRQAPFLLLDDDDDSEDESHNNNDNNHNSPILLEPREVKALIKANAQSKLFQLVNTWEKYSYSNLVVNRKLSLVTSSDDDDDDDETDNNNNNNNAENMLSLKEQWNKKKWKQRTYFAQRQHEKEIMQAGDKNQKEAPSPPPPPAVPKKKDDPDPSTTTSRERLAPPPPTTASRLHAVATTITTTTNNTTNNNTTTLTNNTNTTTQPSSSHPTTPAVHKTFRTTPPDMETFVPAQFGNKTLEQEALIQATVEDNFVFSEFRRHGGKARILESMATLVEAFEPITAKAGQKITTSTSTSTTSATTETKKHGKNDDGDDDDDEDTNEHFYIVTQGQVEIQVDGVIVGRAKKGDCFGEHALLHPGATAATTQLFAVGNAYANDGDGGDDEGRKNYYLDNDYDDDDDDDDDEEGGGNITRVLRLDHKSFRGIMQSHATQAMEAKRQIIQGIDFLKPLLEQDVELTHQLAELLTRQEFLEGETFTVCKNESFHIVQVGTLQVTDTSNGRTSLVDLAPGDYYGKQALLGSMMEDYDDDVDDYPSTTSEITLTGISPDLGVFYSMGRSAMERALGENRVALLQDWNALSQSIPLQGWLDLNDDDDDDNAERKTNNHWSHSSSKTRGSLANYIQHKQFKEQGQNILQDEKADDLNVYVVREGEVLVKYTDTEGSAHQRRVGVGGVFGDEHLADVPKEKGFLASSSQHRRPLDYSAEVSGSDPVSVGILPMKEIAQQIDADLACGVSSETMDVNGVLEGAIVSSDSLQLQNKIRRAVKVNVGLEDLDKISVLGEGQYGEVWLVETDAFQTGVDSLKQRFALKSQYKTDDTRGAAALVAIRREIHLLETLTHATPHPGIVNLINTYEDEDCIYMLMGLIPGGELWSRIHQEISEGEWKSGMPEESAKFYTLAVADTLGFMHSQNILFRDLKPENIMLDDDGYPILVDFGFAKRVADGDKTFTFCGTPNYVAPEIILHSGHDKAVDYWALGVTMYEMVSGENPFYYDGMDQVTLYDTIVREQFYAYSNPTSASLLDLTYQILTKEPNQRLGALVGGVKDILNHPWFADLDVADIRSKRFPAPWKPNSDQKVSVDEEAIDEILASLPRDEEGAANLPSSMINPTLSTASSFPIEEGEIEEEESCDELDLLGRATSESDDSESEHQLADDSSSSSASSSEDESAEESPKLRKEATMPSTPVYRQSSSRSTADTAKHDEPAAGKAASQGGSVLSPAISPRKRQSRRDRERSKLERRSTVKGALMGLGLEDSLDNIDFDLEEAD